MIGSVVERERAQQHDHDRDDGREDRPPDEEVPDLGPRRSSPGSRWGVAWIGGAAEGGAMVAESTRIASVVSFSG